MIISVLLLTLFTVTGHASAHDDVKERGEIISRSENANFYSSYWTDGKSKVTYNNKANGAYSVTWAPGGNFVAGKGWNPGSTKKNVSWTGEFKPEGYSYLSVYGWTRNPLIEYYIIESYHPDHEPAAPPEGEEKGNFTSDDSTYLIRTKMRVNKPSIVGTATFRQIFSVRQDKRENGTVNVQNHFDAWKAAGLKLGSMDYMILATEGMNSSGTASITVL
ncbi:xylanase G1 [Delitschia confertaspora ATCC 74209]|uniref:Endo-1,4-beta-xylanase n=1 Tax=Delitschia confertaspora ATCC 74209 TaxID=1513339 RepID=A0A9P4JQM6_9PLEO|nr:xylanase G1 [Delitschia confertaspora ATCC 74209]